MNPADLRRNYTRGSLDLAGTAADPVSQFLAWFADAQDAGLLEPNAMTLATADANGEPSARIVLLKGVSTEGFVFYTDFRSHKGRDIAENPRAALVFFWGPLERQVRVTGHVVRVSREEAEAYFRTRPVGSRLGAWASFQSAVIGDRAELASRVAELAERHPTGEIPLPPHWGGFRVVPHEVEFWQGRPDRLHDRITYILNPEQGWSRVRLSP